MILSGIMGSVLAFAVMNCGIHTIPSADASVRFQELGYASYYADSFHGNITASGRLFDQNSLTAAHRTLPFGTRLRVTNLRNNRSVIVTVTDRGPVYKNRDLDLSYAGARRLGMLRSGVVPVKLEILQNER